MRAHGYCSLCDAAAVVIVEWTGSGDHVAQAGCGEHRDAALSVITDRFGSAADPERFVLGTYSVTLLATEPGTISLAGTWPALWQRGGDDG